MRLARRDVVVLSDRRAERVHGMALSRDGRTLATGDFYGTIRLRDPETGRVRMALTGHQLPVGHLAFAPDGGRLISVGMDPLRPWRSEVFLWDLTSMRRQACPELSERNVADARFGPGGQSFWVISLGRQGDRRMSLWDVGIAPISPDSDGVEPTRSGLLPVMEDGAIVLLEGQGRRIVVHDLATGKDRCEIAPIGDYRHEMPSPDGRLVALGGASRSVSVWDAVTGRERIRFEVARDDLDGLWFSPDGRVPGTRFRQRESRDSRREDGRDPGDTSGSLRSEPGGRSRVLSGRPSHRQERCRSLGELSAHDGLAARPVATRREVSRESRRGGMDAIHVRTADPCS